MPTEHDTSPYTAPAADLQSEVVTSERGEYVGFWIRALTFIADSALLMCLAITIPFIGSVNISSDGTYHWAAPWWLWTGYLLGFWIWKSATPGKMFFKIKIVDIETLARPKLWQYIVRLIGYAVSAVFLLGFFWIAFNEKKRGWHDYMARTVVIVDLRE